jgi:hypothetical protein
MAPAVTMQADFGPDTEYWVVSTEYWVPDPGCGAPDAARPSRDAGG